jgi:hypothetical protein
MEMKKEKRENVKTQLQFSRNIQIQEAEVLGLS